MKTVFQDMGIKSKLLTQIQWSWYYSLLRKILHLMMIVKSMTLVAREVKKSTVPIFGTPGIITNQQNLKCKNYMSHRNNPLSSLSTTLVSSVTIFYSFTQITKLDVSFLSLSRRMFHTLTSLPHLQSLILQRITCQAPSGDVEDMSHDKVWEGKKEFIVETQIIISSWSFYILRFLFSSDDDWLIWNKTVDESIIFSLILQHGSNYTFSSIALSNVVLSSLFLLGVTVVAVAVKEHKWVSV